MEGRPELEVVLLVRHAVRGEQRLVRLAADVAGAGLDREPADLLRVVHVAEEVRGALEVGIRPILTSGKQLLNMIGNLVQIG